MMTALRVVTLALTALVLVPGGAHLFELPGKIGLDRDAYFTVQTIYAGWALFAIPLFAAIGANVLLYFLERRRHPATAHWALIAAALITVTLAIFFGWVFPGNEATRNWTAAPENWQELRRNWEWGHAVNAALTGLALVATTLAVVKRS